MTLQVTDTTESDEALVPMTPATIDAIVRKARAERAEHVRVMAATLPAKLKRFIAGFRPIRAGGPRTGAWA